MQHICLLTSVHPRLVCRGLGGSSTPKRLGTYATEAMAEDALLLLDHLGWQARSVWRQLRVPAILRPQCARPVVCVVARPHSAVQQLKTETA